MSSFPWTASFTPQTPVFELANIVRGLVPDVPIVSAPAAPSSMARAPCRALVSAQAFAHHARRYCGGCSPTNLPLGDFVFRPTTEVARAQDLTSLEKALHQVPA